MSAIGVSAIAASAEATDRREQEAERDRVQRRGDDDARARMRNAGGPPWKPSAKKTMPSSTVHWMMQKQREQDVLREHVVEERRGSPCARAGRSRARSRSRAPRSRCRTRPPRRRRRRSPPVWSVRRLHAARGGRSLRRAALRLLAELLERAEAPAGHGLLLPAEDEREQHADDRRLEEHDGRAARRRAPSP